MDSFVSHRMVIKLALHHKPEIADRGTVRLGDANITAEFPPSR